MRYLCKNIQGCVLGYTQSDEITLVLVDYQKLNSEAWLDYEVQKMCSIAASMATMAFNKAFEIHSLTARVKDSVDENGNTFGNAYKNALSKGAMFDARCFNIPKEEVTNCIYWRQLDATRNSIQMVGQTNFSHKELHGKSCNMIQDMLMTEKNINWNDLPTYQKRGSCCIKEATFHYDEENDKINVRLQWTIDNEIPIFKNEDREYIDKFVFVGDD